MMSFQVQQRAKIVCWYENSGSFVTVQRKFKKEYGKNSSPPCAETIKKWHKLFMETGSVQDVPRKRKSTSITEEKIDEVTNKFSENPHCSLRSASTDIGISHEAVRKVSIRIFPAV